MTFYNNLPQPVATDNSSLTLKIFDAYTTTPVNVDAGTYDAVTGFFTSRGFGDDSARSMAYAIIKQAISENHSPFQYVDTLKGVDDLTLSNVVTQLLNSSRYKTSSLGTANPFAPLEEVARNIVA